MGKLDKFKAAFLPPKSLNKKLRNRTGQAISLIEEARTLAETLDEAGRVTALNVVQDLERKVLDLASKGAANPGESWVAMDELCKTAEHQRDTLAGADKKADKADPTAMFARLHKGTRTALDSARFGTRGIADDTVAEALQGRLEVAQGKLDTLLAAVNAAPARKATVKQCESMVALRQEAAELSREIRGAQDLPPNPGTERAASKGLMDEMAAMPGFGAILASPAPDQSGRTALEDVQGRLEVFDEHFAADPDKDEHAVVRNTAMRLAAVAQVSGDRTARKVNDPYIAPRLGRAMLSEYMPEIGVSLSEGMDDDEAEAALELAGAMVMDDPVMKLMTGKIDPIDAVQRIRDMAQAGGQEPSKMLSLLRQQFEMKIGSMTAAEVRQGEKKRDKGTEGSYDLTNIVGELSPTDHNAMVDLSRRQDIGGQTVDDTAVWQDDGSGLSFSSGAGQMHKVAAGETFQSIAAAKLGDGAKWDDIRRKNKAVQPLDPKTQQPVVQRLTALGATDPLPVGATLLLPGKLSILDHLVPYLQAWDGAPTKDLTHLAPVVPSGKPPPIDLSDTGPTRKELDKRAGDLVKPSEEQLRAAFAQLRSPRDTRRGADGKPLDDGELDPSYIQAPGLGQEHAPRTSLSDADADDRDKQVKDRLAQIAEYKRARRAGEELPELSGVKRSPVEEEALRGALNDRQYAHIRLIERGDADDREAILRETGKTADELVEATIKERYGAARIDDAAVKKIVRQIELWISQVPLTVTFTASRLFSDPAKAEPTHGATYKSEVELSRGTEKIADLIGRDNKMAGKVGTQGGSKTVTGWKERGENYMRWRRDKDSREGRLDELAYEDQQIFAAANPAFDLAKGGGSKDAHGTNFYGSAHFMLRDSVRNRCVYILRGEGTTLPPVQRKSIGMVIYDLLMNGVDNKRYMDAMFSVASGTAKITAPELAWEVHLYGGFNMAKDASAIYLPSDLDDALFQRIDAFCAANGIDCETIGAKPDGLELVASQPPDQIPLPWLT